MAMGSGEVQVGWQDYLAIVIRRRWHFAIPVVAVVIGAMCWGMFQPRIYRAESVIMIADKSVMNPLIQGLAVSTPISERLRTLREQMLSWTSLSRLVHRLDLDHAAKSPLAFENLIKRLQRDILVKMRGGTLVTIAYEDESPEHAQLLVNTITDIYMERSTEFQVAEAETAITFLKGEMDVYEIELEDSERALREFQELYVMQMPVATQLNDQVIGLEVALAQLLVENTELHPQVVEVRHQVQQLKQKRNEELKRVITTALARGHDPVFYQDLATALETPVAVSEETDPSIRAGQQAYQAWVNRLDHPTTAPVAPTFQPGQSPMSPETTMSMAAAGSVLGAGSTSIVLGPREQQELQRLTRDYDIHAGTYQEMRSRLERAKITQRLGESDEGTKFKILEPARLPLRPVRPNMAKIFFFSLLLGMFIGAAVAFVAEYLDQSFQTGEDLQLALEVPVLGSISTIMTEGDLRARRRRRKAWVSFKHNVRRVKTYVVTPVWARIDKALVKLGL